MNKHLTTVSSVAVAAFLLLATAPAADAAFKLKLSDGVNSVTISDNGVGDSNAVVGVITFNGDLSHNGGAGGGAASTWVVNVTTGISKPVSGSAASAELDLNSVNVTSGGAGTLTLTLTDTDFTHPAGVYGPTSQIGGTTAGSIVFDTWLDPSNAEFGMPGAAHAVLGPLGPGAFSATGTAGLISIAGPFSLTERVVIHHSGAGQVSSFDGSTKVPAPAAATLGAMGLGIVAWLRRRRAA